MVVGVGGSVTVTTDPPPAVGPIPEFIPYGILLANLCVLPSFCPTKGVRILLDADMPCKMQLCCYVDRHTTVEVQKKK